MKKDAWLRTVLLYSPLLLCVGIMLPRLISPQFGFFDDGVVLTTAQRVWAGQWHIADDTYHGAFDRPTGYIMPWSIEFLANSLSGFSSAIWCSGWALRSV